MQRSMTLTELLENVRQQDQVKEDKLVNTEHSFRLVMTPQESEPVACEIDYETGSRLHPLMEHAHRQISAWLNVPWKYYFRLINDHPDLVVHQVNELFKREPGTRMVRLLNGRVRAFLSDRYKRIDHTQVLGAALPPIVKEDFATELLASHVDEHRLWIKCLFTDDQLAHEIQSAGKVRTIRPGFRLMNSETGMGAFKLQAFFYDSYCTNGCVFGVEEAFSMRRTHIGGRLIEGEAHEIQSHRSIELEQELMAENIRDALTHLSDSDKVRAMVDRLRDASQSHRVKQPVAAVDLVARDLSLPREERDGVLESFIRDGDYSKFGLAAAVTEQANDPEKIDFARACELEDLGAKILQLSDRDWSRFVNAEPIAA